MRSGLISEFLRNAGWINATRNLLAGDASKRQYQRLSLNGTTAILMDAPPEAGEDTRLFENLAEYLQQEGFAAPEIIAADHETGLLLIEDLGPNTVAQHLSAHPEDEEEIYKQTAQLLAKLATIEAPRGLFKLRSELAAEMLEPFFEHAAPQSQKAVIKDSIKALFDGFRNEDLVFSLRDFHSENLIWRKNAAGNARLGLLDFQDAFAAPTGYDLASFLRDARRGASNSATSLAICQFAEMTGRAVDDVEARIAILSVQRNLRILGIFAKLVMVENKPGYRKFVPRVRQHIQNDLLHSVFDGHRAPIQMALEQIS